MIKTPITKAILKAVTNQPGLKYSDVVAACPGYPLTSFHSALSNACDDGIIESKGERGAKTYLLPVAYTAIDHFRKVRWVTEAIV